LAFVCGAFAKENELQEYLTSDIQTLIHYPIPPHQQEAYKSWGDLSFPISEKIHEEVLSLPLSPVMSKDDIDQVINSFKSL
jgi:dTDP-4-amino-4,6-dideoxygalactose transaminase